MYSPRVDSAARLLACKLVNPVPRGFQARLGSMAQTMGFWIPTQQEGVEQQRDPGIEYTPGPEA